MEIRFSKSRGCNYVNAIHNKQKWTTISNVPTNADTTKQ